MNLYKLPASNFEAFFGSPEEPTGVNAVIVAQRPDCSAFLVLSENDHPSLTKLDGIPIGYDFTYCQPWGLVVTQELLTRTKRDLVARFPDRFPQTHMQFIKADLEAALDAHIDNVARAKGYDSRITAALRAGYPNPWQQEGIAFGQWMDACYAKTFEIQAAVEAGIRAIPTAEELIAEMPEMVWPT